MVKSGGEGGFVTSPAFDTSTYDDSLADKLIYLNRNGVLASLPCISLPCFWAICSRPCPLFNKN